MKRVCRSFPGRPEVSGARVVSCIDSGIRAARYPAEPGPEQLAQRPGPLARLAPAAGIVTAYHQVLAPGIFDRARFEVSCHLLLIVPHMPQDQTRMLRFWPRSGLGERHLI
jgi:hypothetical protein